ncbi:MAG: hypothetical protein COW65_15355 [Cytophagales bacterium CG18_big_fil_WC_8_21_14_2_50_42_9]|nr:MAG: hypothetical protein COW65_15355 [Cytophagales bacterium CG18_big_fil_WC_8_21_14_2_50_42_9]
MANVKKCFYLNLVLVILIIICIAFIDKPLSSFTENNLTELKPFFFEFTDIFDRLFYHIIWFILFFIVFGTLTLFNKRTKRLSYVFLTVVITVFAAYGVITAKMKTELKRARPEVYLTSGKQTTDFFNENTKDFSFPSSHAAFYLSLFLPFALAFKRYSPLILFIPVVVIIGRVVQNVHYLSDVLCSILIVIDVCLLSFWFFNLIESIWIGFKIKRERKVEDNNLYI